MYSLEDLNPFRFYKHFKDICAIPHGSGHEKALSDYLLQFAAERDLVCRQDDALNVVIKKKAAPGYEKSPPLVLQTHMDMVCEKNSNSPHDFMKDPIIPREKEGYLTADGTTLGADDAAGMAYVMAVLEDKDMPHPAIEAIFTTGEEVGMEGMLKLDASLIEGSRMINLDSDREGVIFASCAGGMRIQVDLPIEHSQISEGLRPYELRVQGLAGGHSGVDIHQNRANAILLLARTLELLGEKRELHVGGISGGGKMNAIPREASAALWFQESDIPSVLSEVERIGKIFSEEYCVSEPALALSVESGVSDRDDRDAVFSRRTLREVLGAICLLPCGILSFSQHMRDEVDTSCNLGVINTTREKVSFSLLARSNTNSKMDDVAARIKHIGEIFLAEITVSGGYPAWEFRAQSSLREICVREFTDFYGKSPAIASIHGGLECALMILKKPDMDMVSFGVNLLDAHTINERVEIASLIRTWKLIVKILSNMNA